MSITVSSYKQEIITNFNKAEDIAHIFSYVKIWQKHLEGRLGLKPVMDNGFGGKEYELPKSRIKPPRAPRQLSDSARKKLVERLHRNRDHLSQNLVAAGKWTAQSKKKYFGYVLGDLTCK